MNSKLKSSIPIAVTVLLFLILVAIIALFVRDLRSSGILRTRPLHYRRQIVKMQPEQIEDWMTFYYINYVFRLPPGYLSEKLYISDPSYPNITLSAYAGSHKLNDAAFTESVRQDVAAYLSGVSQ